MAATPAGAARRLTGGKGPAPGGLFTPQIRPFLTPPPSKDLAIRPPASDAIPSAGRQRAHLRVTRALVVKICGHCSRYAQQIRLGHGRKNAYIGATEHVLRPMELAMPILNGKALVEARNKKGWTQSELSEATRPKINISTISRIERGKPTRVRERTLKELARVLEVGPEDLCPTAEAERSEMKLRIETAARNALTLVAYRYGIRRERIVEIAPLLFYIAVEQSLQVRQKRITELRDAANAVFDLYRGIPHLPRYWPVDENAVSSEEASISARDFFGVKVAADEPHFWSEFDDNFDNSKQNPFVAFLREALATVSNPAVAETLSWGPDDSPDYKICAEEAATIVGNDSSAADTILRGNAALHEMPKGLSPAQRAEWARNEDKRKYNEFLESLGMTPGKDQVSDGEAAP
jgi:transcriptional regulator with XRE-family HTH domain